MKKITLLFALVAMFAFTAQAQKIKKQSGDLSKIKAGSTMIVKFDYTGMTVGKNLTEEEYVEKKVTEYNEKEAGKGDKWKEGWESAREKRYEPKFMELFKKYNGGVVKVTDEEDAKYTLIVKTTFTEPGYNIGIAKQAAFINVDYIIVETANPEKVVAHYSQSKVPGAQAMGYDFDAGSRIAECYAKAGKTFAKFFAKKMK